MESLALYLEGQMVPGGRPGTESNLDLPETMSRDDVPIALLSYTPAC